MNTTRAWARALRIAVAVGALLATHKASAQCSGVYTLCCHGGGCCDEVDYEWCLDDCHTGAICPIATSYCNTASPTSWTCCTYSQTPCVSDTGTALCCSASQECGTNAAGNRGCLTIGTAVPNPPPPPGN